MHRLLVLAMLAASSSSSPSCPEGCFCVERRTDLPAGLAQLGESVSLRVNCHPSRDADPADLLSRLPVTAVSLDLAKYGIQELEEEAFAAAPYLQVGVVLQIWQICVFNESSRDFL